MFIPQTFHHSESEPWELMPATAALNLNVGTALKLNEGKLVKCTATDVPQFICMRKGLTGTNAMIPVERVRPETIYETELSVLSASIKVGKKYTLDSTAEKITATDTSGVAEVVSFDDTAAGSKVRVRFPYPVGGA